MKKFSKILSVALLVALVLSLGVANAFAEETQSVVTQTIRVQNAVPGETYNIYKMLDLSVNNPDNPTAFRYTINTDWEAFWTGSGAGAAYIDTNTAGTGNDAVTYVVWKSDKKSAADMEAFGKAAEAFAKANNKTPAKTAITAPAAAEGEDTVSIAFEGLDHGYYLVTSTLGTAASVASTPESQTNDIYEKNVGNTTEKDVKEDSTEAWQQTNDAQIGQTVEFRSKVTIAKNSTNVVYHDTMESELTWTGAANVMVYTNEGLTVELPATVKDGDGNVTATNYTVAAGTDGETFTVTFDQTYLDSLQAATNVYVAYSGVLNDSAVVYDPVLNTPKVTWGEHGNFTGEPTETTTYKFQILKYDGTDTTKKPLAGAEFQLFTKDIVKDEQGNRVADTEADTPLALAKSTDGLTYRVVDMSDSGTTLPTGYTLVANNTIVTLDSGIITVEGVDDDTYYLEETKAPLGYNKIEGRQAVNVSDSANTVTKAEIANNSGTQLPSTGGIGTTIFYVVGGVLVLAAIILLVTKKRMSE